jgi:glycosyltransferase involved in cell wall biosynthesis
MKPLVSIIIPAYNHEAYVSEAISSVLAQSLADFELIVIDDGSTDATAERIEAFTDERIHFFRQENRGAAATLNRGLELARGKYCTILNSDDRYHSDRLQVLSAKLEELSEVDLIFSAVEIIDEAGAPEAAAWLGRGFDYFKKSRDLFSAVMRDNFVCTTSNLFFRHELIA